MMMQKKAAVQITATFLVSLIVGLVLFGLGVTFIAKFSSSADNWGMQIDNDIHKQIKNTVIAGKIVYVYEPRKEIEAGEQGVFPVGIANVLGEEGKFRYKITSKDGVIPLVAPSSMVTDNQWVLVRMDANTHEFTIPHDTAIADQFGIRVGKGASPGAYTFVVKFERKLLTDSNFVEYQHPILIKIDVV